MGNFRPDLREFRPIILVIYDKKIESSEMCQIAVFCDLPVTPKRENPWPSRQRRDALPCWSV